MHPCIFPQEGLQAQNQGWSGCGMYLAPTQSQTFPQGYCTDWCASRDQIKVFQTSPAFGPAFLICFPWNKEKGVKGNNFIYPRDQFTQEGSGSSELQPRWGKKPIPWAKRLFCWRKPKYSAHSTAGGNLLPYLSQSCRKQKTRVLHPIMPQIRR